MSEIGKAFEDKRGESITPSKTEKCWLYLNGHSVVCTRHMELATMVSSINPSVTNSADCALLSTLQQVCTLNAISLSSRLVAVSSNLILISQDNLNMPFVS